MGISSGSTGFIALTILSFATWGCDSDPNEPAPHNPPLSYAIGPGSRDVSDGHGKAWRQLIETAGRSWTEMAQACPRDGATPCGEAAGGPDLTGYVWATAEQVRALLALYEDDILTSSSVSGPQYFFTADVFFQSFRPTFSFSGYTGTSTFAAGWTSSTDASGAPIVGSVSNGHNMVSFGGSFNTVATADPDEITAFRGVFLWHADGSGGGNVIDAVDDAGSTRTTGGTAVADVLANDLLGGVAPTLTLVTLSQLSSTDAHLTLDPADGSVDVAAGASGGVKQLDYRVCEIASASATNCDRASVTVTVIASVVDAVDDAGAAQSTAGGTAVANVLANDRLDGAQVTGSNVILSLVSATTGGITLDLADGSVDVAAGTAGGAQRLVYRICESASPSNCDQATVTVNVAPQSFVLSQTSFTLKEGSGGQFTVRLSQRPAANVVVAVAFFQGTAIVAPTPATITFTPVNWSVAVTVRFQAPQDSDKYNNAATIELSSPGVTPGRVVATITDDDRPLGDPMAITSAPLNGQAVSGIVSLSATGTDSDGQVVEGRFYVDGVRIFAARRIATTFRMTSGWNTRTVANGWHTLEFRAIDNLGNDGRMLIKVLVSN